MTTRMCIVGANCETEVQNHYYFHKFQGYFYILHEGFLFYITWRFSLLNVSLIDLDLRYIMLEMTYSS